MVGSLNTFFRCVGWSEFSLPMRKMELILFLTVKPFLHCGGQSEHSAPPQTLHRKNLSSLLFFAFEDII
jgi:hypothetical protein